MAPLDACMLCKEQRWVPRIGDSVLMDTRIFRSDRIFASRDACNDLECRTLLLIPKWRVFGSATASPGFGHGSFEGECRSYGRPLSLRGARLRHKEDPLQSA